MIPYGRIKIGNEGEYSVKDLITTVTNLDSFSEIPKNYWILGIQSDEDTYNEFDDTFILFNRNIPLIVTSGTTNAGSTGLMNYQKYNSKGCAVIKTDEWYYDLWKFGYHRGEMPALIQNTPIKFYRDWNKNKHPEEMGELYEDKIGINFHTVLYQKNLSFVRKLIGGWSTGCQVLNSVGDYYKIIDLVKPQGLVSYCLIKEKSILNNELW